MATVTKVRDEAMLVGGKTRVGRGETRVRVGRGAAHLMRSDA